MTADKGLERLGPSFAAAGGGYGRGIFAVPLRPGGWGVEAGDPLGRVPDDRDAWAVFAQADAVPAPGLERLLRMGAEARPDVDLFYGDDVALGETGLAGQLRLKPAFNPALLVAKDYVGAPLLVRGSALHRLGGLRRNAGEAGLYDLLLRAQAAGLSIERIPQVLLAYPGGRPSTPLDDRRRALKDWIGIRPMQVLDGRAPGTLQLARRFEAYRPVTLVVPTRQSGPEGGGSPYVVELLDSLAETDWPMERLHVLIGDDSEAAESYPVGRWPFQLRVIPTPRAPGEPFNYAAKMNALWRAAATEHLVLLNDDAVVRSPDWLKALLTFSMDEDVGAAGARLLFPDGRLQHAGVVGGLFGAVAHAWLGQAGEAATYQDWAMVHRDWSMVTAAVLATRRSVLEAVGGFDERLALEFNDLDLCLRLKILGYRVVYTPFAELTHREKASRGEVLPAADQTALFLGRWRDYLADDPAYHPRLSRDRFAITPVETPDWFG